MATQLPDYQQLQIELEESLNSQHDIFNNQIDQSANEAKSDFVSKVTAEASLVGMSYSELIQAVSSRWENQGLDGDFAVTIKRFVERAKTESDDKYHAIKSKEVTETIEDYVHFNEQYIGEFDWISGGYSDAAFENILAISLREGTNKSYSFSADR